MDVPRRVKSLFVSREIDLRLSGLPSSVAKMIEGDEGTFATRQTDEKNMLWCSGKPEVLEVISAPGVEVRP